MNLKPEQLKKHLSGDLRPFYLVGGDEPFQVGESCDLIRLAARQKGFTERQLFNADTGVDWDAIHAEAQSLSLFGDRRIIEIRLGEKRPDKNGSQILRDLFAAPPPDTLILISSSRLDRRKDLGSKWVKALEEQGVVIQVWPVAPRALPEWIRQRLATHGLGISRDAATLLAERAEGNLLACAQEVDKLALLFPEQNLDVEQIQQSVGFSSRYSPFDLTDALTRGDPRRAMRVLDTLREEGVEPPVVLWALSREIRAMMALLNGSDPGVRMPPQRLRTLEQHAGRLGPGNLQRALAQAAGIDRSIKGMGPASPWQGLASLVLRLSGSPLPASLEAVP